MGMGADGKGWGVYVQDGGVLVENCMGIFLRERQNSTGVVLER